MIGVAHAGGDPDDLIAIRGDDLHTPDDYLEIARALAAAGRQAEALDWARRGPDRFADRHWQTPPLREFLASELRAGGDTAGVEALWWEAFAQQPSVDRYRKLLAESADVEAWREPAIDLLRERLDAGDAEARTRNLLLERSHRQEALDLSGTMIDRRPLALASPEPFSHECSAGAIELSKTGCRC
jgi:hypothetical protein